MLDQIKKFYHPKIFQGNLNRKNYFEGWYYKHVTPDNKKAISFIPGISLSSDAHAFIQVNNGIDGSVQYFKFPMTDFKAVRDIFEIKIGKNIFNLNYCQLDLKNKVVAIKGRLNYRHQSIPKRNFFRPSIMGWYSYVPFMTTKHEVISLDHKISGELIINNQAVNFTGGKGYIEKDWGTSFPKDYLWLQCNNFSDSSISLMLSVAKITWLGKSFIGFLGFVKFKNNTINFATHYNHKNLSIKKLGESLNIIIKINKYVINIITKGGGFKALKSPQQGKMTGIIKESISSQTHLKVTKDRQVITQDQGYPAGLEIHNNILKYFQ